jgi:tRNA G37 N-methylase Trm5
MEINAQKNKIPPGKIHCFNKDAREFIRDLVSSGVKFTHIYMNLPAIALEFLDVFYALFSREEWPVLPILHVYAFSTAEAAHDEFRARIVDVWDDVPDL